MVHMASEMSSVHQAQNILDVKRIGGGNIVSYRPVFSKDSSKIFLVKGCLIQAYSVKTGALIQDYVGLDTPAIGVQLHPADDELLVACSEQGELISWRLNSQAPGDIVKLDLPDNEATPCKFLAFQLILTEKIDGSETCDVFATLSNGALEKAEPLVFCSNSGVLRRQLLKISVDHHSHSLSFGGQPGKRMLATISNNRLFAMYTSNMDKVYEHWIESPNKFTCVSCHPELEIVAAGNTLGMVIVWHSVMVSRGTRSVYHWHQLPVQDIVFSSQGTFFYSGAAECVLVKWEMDNPKNNTFLPRLSGPIQHVAISPNNQFVSSSTEDNAVVIANPHMRLVSSIQNLTWGVSTGIGQKPFAAGICVEPRSGALVLNGRVGHVQFFDLAKKTLNYNLDITCQNYLSQEKDRVIVNTSVIATAISSDGSWLATVEERDDKETSLESRLKFWSYHKRTGAFKLNTSFERPHNGSTTAVRFQASEFTPQILAATIGSDKKFRLWSLVRLKSLKDSKKGAQVWQCESVGFHKNLLAQALAFSQDGSLLAVAFASALTVWVPETTGFKCSLTHPTVGSEIRQVEFGRGEVCELMVAATEHSVCVWNLLSLSLAWTVDVAVSMLVADPYSSAMAVFTQDNSLFVFNPSSCQPLYQHKDLTAGGALAAAFAPRVSGHKPGAGWLSDSQLYFLGSNQELLVLTDADDGPTEELAVLGGQTRRSMTPFAALMARHAVSEVKRLMPMSHHLLGDPGADAVREFLAAPCHTMPGLALLCGEFLQSFVGCSDSYTLEEHTSKPVKMDVVDEDDEEMERINKSLRETKVSQADPAAVDRQLEQILKENLDWVDKYGVNA